MIKPGDIVRTPDSQGILRDYQGKPALVIKIDGNIVEVDAGKPLLYDASRLTPIGHITLGKERSIRGNRFCVCSIRLGDEENRVDVKVRDASGWQLATALDIKRQAWKQFASQAVLL